jgi:hypothetical protein
MIMSGEGLKELLGHEQEGPGGRDGLLDRDRAASQAGAACRLASGGEPGAAGRGIPDGQDDAEIDSVPGQEAGVLNVAAGQDRAGFGRPDPLADPGPDHQRDQQRAASSPRPADSTACS